MFKFKFISRLMILLLFIIVTMTLAGCRHKVQDTTTTDATTTTTDYTPSTTVTQTKLVVYDGPSMLQSSSDVGVKVEDKNLFVYDTLVNNGRLFTFTPVTTTTPVAMFDFEGSVSVTITVNSETVSSAVVRPLKYGIQPVVSGNTITFTLDYPSNYVVEYNGETTKAINLFANPLETDTPDANNIPDNMIYLGPGVYKADAIPVQSNETIYIAGGALVYGQIRADGVDNVTIRGRGILDGSIFPRLTASQVTVPIEFRNSTNITIEGISILDPAGWTITSYFNDGVLIDNIKIITARPNGDGISIQSSKNVEVKNSFVRTWDDSLVVKNYDRGITDNVHFDNMTIWTDLAQSMEIGYETNGATMNNISFTNITVLHNFHKPVISIHNSDDAQITNILYQNITVEDAQEVGDDPTSSADNFLVDFQIQYNQSWTKSGGVRGSIDNVTINNLLVLNGSNGLVSRISGYDADHKITNVHFNNVTFKGVKVNNASDLNLTTNQFATNVSYNFTTTESTGAKLILPYNLDLSTNDTPQITEIANISQQGYIVPDFAKKELPQVYMGEQVTGSFTASSTHGLSILVWDDETGSFDDGTNVAANVLDQDKTTQWIGKAWTNENGEFASLNVVFDSNKKIGTVRVYGDANSDYYQLQNIAVYGIKSTSTTNVYTKLLNSYDYEFSPASGNYADIKINPGEFKAIQLRFYHREGVSYPQTAFTSEVEFYPASLTYNQAVTASPYEDVYVASNLTDGNPLTYYESKKGEWPAEVIVDMAGVYNVGYIDLALPPLMQWTSRTQTITVYASTDGSTYSEIVPQADYTFNPQTGNLVEIHLNSPQSAQYIKFVFTGNSDAGGEGAQVSEISVFE